eukprot:Nk52_evm9s298 gene=Nk52_evmTU9s298
MDSELLQGLDSSARDRISQMYYEQVKECQERLNKWKEYDEDYKSLASRLETLGDKVSHDVTVPLGKLAFMPGKLVHTNEIMVLLGENYFAERSAKQAVEIINRRHKFVKDNIVVTQKELNELTARATIDEYEEGDDVVEIKEEIGNETVFEKRSDSRGGVIANEERGKDENGMDDKDILEKLMALEIEEEALLEDERMIEDVEEGGEEISSTQKVTFAHTMASMTPPEGDSEQKEVIKTAAHGPVINPSTGAAAKSILKKPSSGAIDGNASYTIPPPSAAEPSTSKPLTSAPPSSSAAASTSAASSSGQPKKESLFKKKLRQQQLQGMGGESSGSGSKGRPVRKPFSGEVIERT